MTKTEVKKKAKKKSKQKEKKSDWENRDLMKEGALGGLS